jgi:hypothetical protein
MYIQFILLAVGKIYQQFIFRVVKVFVLKMQREKIFRSFNRILLNVNKFLLKNNT